MAEVPDDNLEIGDIAFNLIVKSPLMDSSAWAPRAGCSKVGESKWAWTQEQGAQHTSTERRCYLRGQLLLKSPDHPCPAVPLPALTAVICRWLSLALCDVGLGVSSIKKSLKLRESMVGSTLLAKGASGNYSIHHNYTNWTPPHRGQGTQIPSWPHWTRLRAYREGRREGRNG